jgi:amidophosphoribosyltransferase
VFLPLASLREAIPNHTGDWYFSGNYPTPGGNKVVNRAYMNWFEGKSGRSYD